MALHQHVEGLPAHVDGREQPMHGHESRRRRDGGGGGGGRGRGGPPAGSWEPGRRTAMARNSQCMATRVAAAATPGKNGVLPVMTRLMMEPRTMTRIRSKAVARPMKRFLPRRTMAIAMT